MKAIRKILFLSGMCTMMYHSSNGQLQITNESVGLALAQKLVGTGVVISNVTLVGDRFATGFFNNLSGTNIGIDSGIVLTNGWAKSVGTNWGLDGNGIIQAQTALADADLGMAGDQDLANSIGVPLSETNDACILEFDFVPLGDSIKFKYVFSSEEYTPAYVCLFNDAFAFFISGPGIPGLQNIALVPGTSIPVSIFNVNNVPGGACPNNMAYYTDNKPNTFFTHDGHTTVLTALAQVQPCQTYHLKLVIADVGDHAFDSGVFLEAKSLSSNSINITNTTQIDPQNNYYLVEGCSTGSFKIKRPSAESLPLTVALSYAGTAINGVDMQLLPSSVTIPSNQSEVIVNVLPIIDNMPEGIETLKIYALAGGGCSTTTATDSTIIQIRDYDTLGIIPDTAIICKNTSIQLNATAGFYSVYQWDPNPTLSNLNIRDPVATPVNSQTTYYCTSTEGTCNGRDSAFIQWKQLDFISKTDILCKNDANGEIIVNGGPAWIAPVQYSINNGPWQANGIFSNLIAGTYRIKVTDASGCIDSLDISIIQLFPDLLVSNMAIVPATCSGNADGIVTITATGGKSPYVYSVDGINFQSSNIFNLAQGNYTITLKDANNCLAVQNITVPLFNSVTLDAGTDKTICEGKNVQLLILSNANGFVWSPSASLDNNTIKEPVASPVVSTKYYVTATTGICSQIDSVMVFVNPAPVANAGPDQNICYGQNAPLSGTGGISYFWSPPSFLTDRRSQTPTAINLPGSISYFLHVTDINGCVSLVKDEVHITVTRPAIVYAGRDTTLAVGQPLQLFALDVNSIGFIQYIWSPAYGLNDASIAGPMAILDKDITYTVTALTSIGCLATDEIKIKVYKGPDIYVPNAFSPNRDGLNDILHAIPVGIAAFHYFRIYDRWGTIVFTTNNASNGWDGTIKGLEQPIASYVWMAEGIDYRGNMVRRKGMVTIVK